MTAFDYAVLAVLGLSLLLGVWRGLASEVLALAAWIVAFLAGKMLAPEMAPLFGEWIREPALRFAAAFGVIAVLVLAVAAIARLLLSKLLRAVGLGPLDRFLGAAFGVARGGADRDAVGADRRHDDTAAGGLVARGEAGTTAGNGGAGFEAVVAAGGGEAHSL